MKKIFIGIMTLIMCLTLIGCSSNEVVEDNNTSNDVSNYEEEIDENNELDEDIDYDEEFDDSNYDEDYSD